MRVAWTGHTNPIMQKTGQPIAFAPEPSILLVACARNTHTSKPLERFKESTLLHKFALMLAATGLSQETLRVENIMTRVFACPGKPWKT